MYSLVQKFELLFFLNKLSKNFRSTTYAGGNVVRNNKNFVHKLSYICKFRFSTIKRLVQKNFFLTFCWLFCIMWKIYFVGAWCFEITFLITWTKYLIWKTTYNINKWQNLNWQWEKFVIFTVFYIPTNLKDYSPYYCWKKNETLFKFNNGFLYFVEIQKTKTTTTTTE